MAKLAKSVNCCDQESWVSKDHVQWHLKTCQQLSAGPNYVNVTMCWDGGSSVTRLENWACVCFNALTLVEGTSFGVPFLPGTAWLGPWLQPAPPLRHTFVLATKMVPWHGPEQWCFLPVAGLGAVPHAVDEKAKGNLREEHGGSEAGCLGTGWRKPHCE